MNINLQIIKSLLQNRHVYPTIIIVTVDIILCGFLIFYGFTLYSTYNNMLNSEDQVQQMRATITLIRNNRSLFQQGTEKYNEILEKLIPDQESYFLVISALEQLSEKTGVTIDTYSVNLSSTTEEKLTLSVSITGDPESVQKFIQEYKYASGRLITIEKMDLNPENLQSLTFSMNFFHNEFKDTVSLDSKISTQDLEKLEEIGKEL